MKIKIGEITEDGNFKEILIDNNYKGYKVTYDFQDGEEIFTIQLKLKNENS